MKLLEFTSCRMQHNPLLSCPAVTVENAYQSWLERSILFKHAWWYMSNRQHWM